MPINLLKSSLLFLCSQFLNKISDQLKPMHPGWRERLKPVLRFTNSGLLCHPINSEFPAQYTATLYPPSSSSFPDSATRPLHYSCQKPFCIEYTG